MREIKPCFIFLVFKTKKQFSMKKLYFNILALVGMVTYGQEVTWQRNIKSNTQDFLSQLTTTIDGQILLSGSTIQTNLFILLMRGRLSTQGKRPIMNFR